MSEEKKNKESGHFLICDIQTEYAEHLQKVLEDHFSEEYQFHFFRDAGKMKEFAESGKTDILLTCEEYEAELSEKAGGANLFILTDDREYARRRRDGYTYIFRYQPADTIVRELRKGIKKTRSPERSERYLSPVPEQRKRVVRIRDEPGVRGIVGVYSPIHRIGKTKFAIRLGQKLAAQIPVLYLNMEGYSGGDFYFSGRTEYDLGDLIYCMKQERTDYGIKISTMTGQIDGLDYISPMNNEQDLRMVSKDEWITLLDRICDECIYEAVILDLGDCINGLYEIMRKCTKIYTPYICDSISDTKMEQYENNLRESGYEDVLRKTVRRQMKKAAGIKKGSGSENDQDGNSV